MPIVSNLLKNRQAAYSINDIYVSALAMACISLDQHARGFPGTADSIIIIISGHKFLSIHTEYGWDTMSIITFLRVVKS